MSGRRVLVIGEALVDIVHRVDGSIDETPGGSPANVALALGRLDDDPVLLTQLGDDARGSRVRAWLDASAVEVLAAPAERTSTATARLDADGSARYDFDLTWTLDSFDPATLDPDSFGVVHTGSIAALVGPGALVVRRVLAASRDSSLITYDPNVRPALLPDHRRAREDVESLVALSDVVKVSDEDLEWLFPGADALEIAWTWLATGPTLVVVTMGAGGAFAVSPAGVTRVRGRRVEVVDTVGAGDTFMSALIHGILDRGSTAAAARERLRTIDEDAVRDLLRLGVLSAAVTVSRPGADPPRLAELTAALPRDREAAG